MEPKKKRSIAKSMLSLILVFAMVISNVQTAPGMLSTVWAAESETAVSDETDGTSNDGESSSDHKTGSNDDGGRAGETEEISEDSEQSKTDETEEAAKSDSSVDSVKDVETTDHEETTEETEKAGSTEESRVLDEVTETAETETAETEEETTEEESKEVNGDNDDAKAVTETVRIHFSNTLGWEKVNLHYWGDGITGSGTWPGKEITAGTDGYYTIDVPIDGLSGDFGYIFNNGIDGNDNKTIDGSIAASNFDTEQIYECWVWLDGTKSSEGLREIQMSTNEPRKPVIHTDESGNKTVTFYYENTAGKSVVLKGVNGDEWTGDTQTIERQMEEEEGTDFVTCTIDLKPEGFMYKFVVDGNWIFDPGNSQVLNNNSYINEASKNAKIKLHLENTLNWDKIALHYWGMGITGTQWPGNALTKDEDSDYYTVDIDVDGLIHDFGLIITDGETEVKKQTADKYIKKTELTDNETYDLWARIEEKDGGYILQTSEPLIISPEVNGNTVTFRYENSEAENVYVRGTMTNWVDNDSYKMIKDENGVHTLEVELPHGIYEYKFHYEDGSSSGVWLRDPNNSLDSGGNDPNSVVYVQGADTYTYTIHYYNPNADVPTTPNGPDLYIWDECSEAATAEDYPFTEITKDTDEKGKTWLTTTIQVPYPHINVIGRPTGEGGTGAENTEYTYELKKGTTAELWFVYGDGIYEKNPYLETYKYTIHYYNPAAPDQDVSTPDLYVWGVDSSNPGKQYPFTDTLSDEANDVTWLTSIIEIPYKNIGFIGKPTAGDNWTAKDSDRKYQLKGEATEAELWYIHGVGVYDKKPGIKLDSVAVSLQLDSMNYAQNNVLTLILNGSKDSGAVIKSASVDTSALGTSDSLVIDPQLCEVTLSVRDNVAAGTYKLPVTVEGISGEKQTTEASVTVTEKADSEKDFDWDEAVIYFMVTDRFFNGNESNDGANGIEGEYNTAGDNPGLYHGGDFAGVTARLDYLKELGVNTIWITPIVENIKGVTVDGEDDTGVPYYAAYHGYWASDFEKLNPALGTEEEFETLINTAHEKGMKIMVDVVVNHAGYGMEDTDKFEGMLRASEDVDETNHELGGYQAGLPDFLTEIPEVRDKIINWQVKWLDKGIDYFRVDTVQHVDDTTWRAFKNALTKANPNFKMIGEYFGAGYNSANGDRLGSGQMDSLLDFNFNEWATDFVNGNISSVESALTDRNKALNNTYLTGQFLSSHDEIGFKQNLIKNGKNQETANALSMVAATLQITAKGQPVIYYGEEIGLTGDNDYPKQTNRYDFDWDAIQDNSTLNHYKKMLAIRGDYSEVFAKGDRKFVISSNPGGYDVISRSYSGTTLYVGMNIKSAAQTVTFSVNADGISGYRDLYSDTTYKVADDNTIEVTIPSAADGGTVVLVADSFMEGLIAPKLTAVKGRETTLPAQLTRMSESGEETLVNVTYSMDAVEGVTLDDANKKIAVEETFEGKTIELTAAAGEDSVQFTVKVVEDKNQITLNLHYNRSNKDNDYTGWNVWSWRDGSAGKQYDFESDDENGGKVVTFELEGRSTSVLNYIIRKSISGNDWVDKDVKEDCFIDLSDILSGTVDYYVTSGEFPGTRVLGDDVLIGVKIRSAEYNSGRNIIKITTGTPITGSTDGIFTLKRSDGTEIAITAVKQSVTDENEYELSIDADLSGMEEIVKKYYLIYDGFEYDVKMPSLYSSEEFESQYTYTGNDLGAAWTKEKTTFKVWAPTADKVQVNLYESGTEKTDDLIKALDMTRGEQGVWSAEETEDLNGVYYTYNVTVDGTTVEACDPYARTTGVNGNRAMVLDLDSTDPEGWADDSGPNKGMSYTDSVIYELHVRDFSIDKSSGISDEHKGKFLGLTETGTTNQTGQTTGLDYLTDLGVTHIHLLPSYDYATVDETKLDEPQYNWGYDPKNYNVPEGSYSTDPYNGEVRVKEMKQMIKTLHDNDINVIMDVVYNHVYDADKFCFNQLVPKYFSRTNADGSYSSGSGCGNDTASERSMVKKYIVDSVNYWADEYHIDGFRFDLVGLLDTETINEVVDTVHQKHPDAVFYGEGWTMDTAVSKDGYTMATQANSEKTPKFAYFSDTIRNLLKGDTFSETSTGFISGLKGQEELLAKCFMAAADWCKSPTQTVNYASCHDNYSLMDKLAVSRADASKEDRIRMNNLAAAIYMTAEGIPLIHAGEEILREKLDENGKPVENSYNSSDLVNSIKWSNLDNEAYRNVRDYYKGLIEFRKNHAALRLTKASEVSANVSYKWITNELVVFVINGRDSIADEVSDGIIVIFNANTTEQSVDLYDNYGIEEGTWNVCINDRKAGIETLESITDGKVTVAPISALVLVKGETKDSDSVYDKNTSLERTRQALRELIADCEKLHEQGNYTDESWSSFQEALAAAKQAVEDTEITEDKLLEAKERLQQAYDGLDVLPDTLDTGKLAALIETCREMEDQGRGNYTEESWQKFTEALAEAKKTLADPNADQTAIDNAHAALDAAKTNLQKEPVKIDDLKTLIDQYGALEQGNYTDDSWNTFQQALAAAKEVVENPNAAQEDVDKAAAQLQAAYNALQVNEGTVDTGKLKLQIDTCKEAAAQGQGDYTDETWTAFTKALSEAEQVLANADADQDMIDTAEKNLRAAYENLAKKPAPEPDEEYKEGLWTKWAPDSGLTLADGQYHITYTGKAIKPAIQVYDGKVLLKEKTDYTVAYKANTNAGEAVVTIKGKGNYTESHTENFVIDKVDLASLEVSDLYAAVAVNNTKQVTPKPVVKYNGKGLRLNKDYTVSYADPSNDGKTPGTYTVNLEAKPDSQNFTGSTTIRMILADKDKQILMTKVSIGKIAAQNYQKDEAAERGKIQTPDITVKYKGKVLKQKDKTPEQESWDYEVIWDATHTEAGETAVITVRGNGTEYVGEKTASFKINGIALKASAVAFKDMPKSGLVYTGQEQEPVVTVKDAESSQFTVSYEKNTDVGTASVIVTGRNGYSGSVKKNFKITAYDISTDTDNKFTFGENDQITSEIPYAKGGSKLDDAALNARFTVNAQTVTLEQGKDYTLTYTKNKAVGSSATVTIKGKGNFKGTIAKVPFTIVKQNLNNLQKNAAAADILLKNASKYNKTIPVIVDLDGKALKNKVDFTVDSATAYTDVEDNPLSGTLEVGQTIKVTATAKGNYEGEVSALFRVIANDKSVSKATVKISGQTYTGSEIKPTSADDAVKVTIKVKENGQTITKELKEHEDYEIIGYSNNTKKGTAKLTIHGIGEYGGTKTASFKITAQKMK